MTDQERELAIERAYIRLTLAHGKRSRRHAWNELQTLIKARSPEQIERMERASRLIMISDS